MRLKHDVSSFGCAAAVLRRVFSTLMVAAALAASACTFAAETSPPVPLLAEGKPVDWWFVFKFNAKDFPGCGTNTQRQCTFDAGKRPPTYNFSLQFAYASSTSSRLQQGSGCAGDTGRDPLGATFSQIFNGDYYYVVWNDQPCGDPGIAGCEDKGNCVAPWGHSKGLLAWNDKGEGLVLQVSTPSWPLAASLKNPRNADANTLGCIKDDDVKLSQHFFALRLRAKDAKAPGDDGDVAKVLKALVIASVVTDPMNPQLVRNGGRSELQSLIKQLGGKPSNGKTHSQL